MKLLVLVVALLGFIRIPRSSSLGLRRKNHNVDFSRLASPLLRHPPQETSNGTSILDQDMGHSTHKDAFADEERMRTMLKYIKKSRADISTPMMSTAQGICMYNLPARFNLGLLNSTFKQPVPQPLNISPSSTPPLQGMFDTIQFSLERIFYDRFTVAAIETRAAKDCVLFYVPYFLSWETSAVHGTWVNAHRPELDAELFKHLTHYNLSGVPGRKHFFVIGRISLNVNHFLADPVFTNTMKLVLEDTSPGEHPNVFAIPYPTWFRYYPSLEPNNPALGMPSAINVQSAALSLNRKVKGCDPNWFGSLTARLHAACDGKEFCSYHILTDVEQWVAGSVYEAMDANGKWWPVTVKAKNPDGTISVDVHDGPGTHWPRVYAEHMRNVADVKEAANLKCPALDVSGNYSCGGATYSFRSLPGHASLGHAIVLGCPRGPCWLWGSCESKHVSPAPESNVRTGPLLAIIGSARATEYERVILFKMCEARPHLCAVFHTGHRENSTSFVHDHIADMYQVLMASTFCLNPPGDTPTRKGLFDSLVLGCIPVITSEDSLQHYRFHLPFWRSVSVLVTTDQLFSLNFNLADFLEIYARDNAQEVLQKQAAIKKYAYSLQYSFSPATATSFPPSTTPVQRGPDAFDTILQSLLAQPGLPAEDFTGVYAITGVGSGRKLFANADGDYATSFGASAGQFNATWQITGRGDGTCCYGLLNVASQRALYAQVNATDWTKFGASSAHSLAWSDQKWRLVLVASPDVYNIVNVASGRRLFALPKHEGNVGIGATLRTTGSRGERWDEILKWQVQKVA